MQKSLNKLGVTPGFTLWLIVAIVVHISLVFIPLSSVEQQRPKPPDTISIDLTALLPKPEETQPEEAQQEEIQPEPIQPEDVPESTEEIVQTSQPEPIPEQPAIEELEETEEQLPSTAQLLDAAADAVQSDETDNRPIRLGQHRGRAKPKNWTSPVLPTRPGDTQPVPYVQEPTVIDRWEGSGETQHVMVELPNGKVMCGRRDAVDILRPEYEPLMMFGECGSGQKKRLSFKREYTGSIGSTDGEFYHYPKPTKDTSP